MKYILILIFICFFSISSFSESILFWRSNIKEIHYSENNNKKYLIIFVKSTNPETSRYFYINLKNRKDFNEYLNFFQKIKKIYLNYNPQNLIQVFPPSDKILAMEITSYSFISDSFINSN